MDNYLSGSGNGSGYGCEYGGGISTGNGIGRGRGRNIIIVDFISGASMVGEPSSGRGNGHGGGTSSYRNKLSFKPIEVKMDKLHG
jgi:hypothetical protein